MRKLGTVTLILTILGGMTLGMHAAEENTQPAIKALLITGGCCHDYDNQKTIIPEGVNAHTTAKIDWTVVHQGGKTTNTEIPIYKEVGWAKGFDVVVHNECFAAVGNAEFIEKILAPHRAFDFPRTDAPRIRSPLARTPWARCPPPQTHCPTAHRPCEST